jgi:hypothetical protein
MVSGLNATLSFLEPVSYTVGNVVQFVSFLVGGIVGIYIIMMLVRILFFRKIVQTYQQLQKDVRRLEQKIDQLSEPAKPGKKGRKRR